MQFSENLDSNLGTLFDIIEDPWPEIDAKQRNALTQSAFRTLQLFTSDNVCCSKILAQYPSFYDNMLDLLRIRNDELMKILCKDVIINFLHNGQIVPKELY